MTPKNDKKALKKDCKIHNKTVKKHLIYLKNKEYWQKEIDLAIKKTNEFCQICLLNETCQNNFDYECIEASDFLYGVKIETYTVKDDFLDSLTNKSNKALRG